MSTNITATLSRACAEDLCLQHSNFWTVKVQERRCGGNTCASEPPLVQLVCICLWVNMKERLFHC